MKHLLVAFFMLLSNLAFAGPGFGEQFKINDNWKFLLNPDDESGLTSVGLNDESWTVVNLPHDWSVRGEYSKELYSATGYLPGGKGWYRKDVFVPSSRKGEKVYLYFEGIYNRSKVYVNGKLVGDRPNGYIPYLYDITDCVEYDGNNIVAVSVDHTREADCRWYTGSGIYRDVYLVYSSPIHFEQWGVYAYSENITKKTADLKVKVAFKNEAGVEGNGTIVYELRDLQGRIVAMAKNIVNLMSDCDSVSLVVRNPKLWSLESPSLYELQVRFEVNGEVVDSSSFKTGFRSFTFDPDKGMALNGENIKVKGVCLHHDLGVLGSAVYPDVWRVRLLALKSLGCNAIRTSHNPQASSLYELCDELGLLVLDEAFDEWEFAKRKWLEGWNVGTPGYDGSHDIFLAYGEMDLADMVRRDRNHVCIFAWSIGNEVDYPNDPYSHPVLGGTDAGGFTQAIYGGYKKDSPNAERLGDIAIKLVDVVKKYDKSRPVTAGLAGVAMSNETKYPFALDITGYNYTESKYGSDHEKYPNRVIFGSENRHDYEAWLAVKNNEHIFGQFLWTGADYLGESTPWPSRGFYSGLINFGNRMKPLGYFRKSLWLSSPSIYIGTYRLAGKENEYSTDAWDDWNYEEGEMVRVVCYTNTEYAKLMLNGQEIGGMKEYDSKRGLIAWDIPYSKGTLTVSGCDAKGKTLVEYSIASPSTPVRIETQVISSSDDIVQVLVQIKEADGRIHYASDREVICVVENGELLGMENSNNRDMSCQTDNRHHTFRGEMIVYVRPEKSKVSVMSFSSPDLGESRVVVK